MKRWLDGPDATTSLVALAVCAALLALVVVGQWRAALVLLIVGGLAVVAVSR